jgi:hypothetical protein
MSVELTRPAVCNEAAASEEAKPSSHTTIQLSSAGLAWLPQESAMGCNGRGAIPGDALDHDRSGNIAVCGAGTPGEYLPGGHPAAGLIVHSVQRVKYSINAGARTSSGTPCHLPTRLRWEMLGIALAMAAAIPVRSSPLPALSRASVGTFTEASS